MRFPKTLIEKATNKKDIRPFANHPYLDVENKRLMASQGHILAIVSVEVHKDDVSGPVSEEALKAARKNNQVIICHKNNLVVIDGPTFPRPKLEKDYPDMDKVVPDKKDRIIVGLNAELLFNLAKAIGEGDHNTLVRLHIDPNDSEKASIYVSNSSDNYGVIMPALV